jgi:glucose-1-phosphate thymidylyltransferase
MRSQGCIFWTTLQASAPRGSSHQHVVSWKLTTLLETYLHDGMLNVQRMGRGYAWLDTGTHGSLLDAGNFVPTLETRQGLQTGSPEEIAFDQGWISATALEEQAKLFENNEYGVYLSNRNRSSK